MFTFFVKLYSSLLIGSWQNVLNNLTIRNYAKALLNNFYNWICNALGGNFTALQTLNIFEDFPSYANGDYNFEILIGLILATITMVGVCFAVWKVIKYLFSIFFYGWRN